ncbi:hypothetical protein [Streptomyces sp. NPDC050264]|uniref:hypothetical protein n=1 Tax=Streptomyces sp. NPDC050264 TaxID=3155038 RepID=UPI003414AE09
MCHSCADLAVTSALISDLSAYADTPDADAEFVDVTAYGLAIAVFVAYEAPLYPPPGHGYPRQNG